MFNKKTISIFIIVLLAGVLTLTGCGNNADSNIATTTLDKIKESGKIVLGTSADFPPYEFHKSLDGQDVIVGFDVEIAKEIAKDLGVELEIKDMKFDGLLAALQTGNVDFVLAGMTPTEERQKNVDFSKLYYETDQYFLVKEGEGCKYNTIENLTGLKIGAQKGSIQEEIALNDVKDAQVKSLGKVTDLVLELKNNKIVGVIVAKPVALAYAEANDDLEVAEVIFKGGEGSAVALKKGNESLLKAINESLDKLIAEDKINQFFYEASKIAESN